MCPQAISHPRAIAVERGGRVWRHEVLPAVATWRLREAGQPPATQLTDAALQLLRAHAANLLHLRWTVAVAEPEEEVGGAGAGDSGGGWGWCVCVYVVCVCVCLCVCVWWGGLLAPAAWSREEVAAGGGCRAPRQIMRHGNTTPHHRAGPGSQVAAAATPAPPWPSLRLRRSAMFPTGTRCTRPSLSTYSLYISPAESTCTGV